MPTTSPAIDGLLTRLRDLGLDGQVGPELSAVDAELEATINQLEAANDELRASTAELEATSTELERAATELGAVHDELELRSADVERVTGYLQSAIDGVAGAVVVLDVDQKVRAWSIGATERWEATASDVLGRALGRLDLHGENTALAACARAVLAGEGPADPTMVGDDGAEARAHPLRGVDGALDGVVLVIVAAPT